MSFKRDLDLSFILGGGRGCTEIVCILSFEIILGLERALIVYILSLLKHAEELAITNQRLSFFASENS